MLMYPIINQKVSAFHTLNIDNDQLKQVSKLVSLDHQWYTLGSTLTLAEEVSLVLMEGIVHLTLQLLPGLAHVHLHLLPLLLLHLVQRLPALGVLKLKGPGPGEAGWILSLPIGDVKD